MILNNSVNTIVGLKCIETLNIGLRNTKLGKEVMIPNTQIECLDALNEWQLGFHPIWCFETLAFYSVRYAC